MNTEELLEKYEKYTIDNREDLLSMMRKEGLSMGQSTMLLVLKFKINITEADQLILNSETWKDEREKVEAFRNHIFDIIDECSDKTLK
ncbi:hypothetical protein [Chryseobacterium lactis]|uniref:hypothetical protein n=1 Tax=Chryseobacterium lactis TaxID=1241981 RepID=UPI0016246059|nr:hypothetical protein [Chryseobacterium lactis]